MPDIIGTAAPRRRTRLAKKPLPIKEEIGRRLKSGEYSTQLPSVVKLTEEFGVSPLTIRKALAELEREGLIERRERVGIFVKRKQRIALLYVSEPGFKGGRHAVRTTAYAPLADAIETELESGGYNLVFRSCPASERNLAEIMLNEVDGCVVIAAPSEATACASLLKGVPWVRVMSLPCGNTGNIHITYDNALIGSLAAEYLIKPGRKTYAYFGSDSGPFKDRLESFMRGVGAAQGEFLHICATGMDEECWFAEIMNGLRSLLAKRKPSEIGLYIASDMFAVLAYQAIYSLGLTPVKDIAVLSTDNNPWYLHGLLPRPPTIDIRMDEIGRAATRALLDIIAGRRRPDASNETILFPPVIQDWTSDKNP